MTSDESSVHSARRFGPIQIVPASVGWQLLGAILVFIGFGISFPAVYSISSTAMVFYVAFGGIFVLSGLHLSGVRVR